MGVTIAFRRSVPRPQKNTMKSNNTVIEVTIAFRRSVPRPRPALLEALKELALSPLPFGVLSPGHAVKQKTLWTRPRKSPLPFGVLSPGHKLAIVAVTCTVIESPLPFGVLSPGHEGCRYAWSIDGATVTIAFRRSVPRPQAVSRTKHTFRQALSPLPFGVLSPGHKNEHTHHAKIQYQVTIAFRRSVPRPRSRRNRKRRRRRSRSPLPFGVLSPGHFTRYMTSSTTHNQCHHCLSAFCPPATIRMTYRIAIVNEVTIAFRRSVPRPPSRRTASLLIGALVTIAFRRSVPRPRVWIIADGNKSPIVTIAFRRSVPRPPVGAVIP